MLTDAAALIALGMVFMIVSTSGMDCRTTSRRSVGSLGGGVLQQHPLVRGTRQMQLNRAIVWHRTANVCLRHYVVVLWGVLFGMAVFVTAHAAGCIASLIS